MNEAWLRKSYEKSGFQFPDDVWQTLVDEGYVRAVLQNEPEAKAKLVQAAVDLLNYSHHKHPGWTAEMRAQEPVDVKYEDSDRLHIRALSQYFAALADKEPAVSYFRREVLGENKNKTPRLLDKDEAQRFLTSRATAVLSLEQFRKWQIPVIGHEVWPDDLYPADKHSPTDYGRHEPRGRSVTLTINPPGSTFVVRAPSSQVTIDGYRLVAGTAGPDYPARIHCDSLKEAWFAAKLEHGCKIMRDGLSAEDRKLLQKAKQFVKLKTDFLATTRDAYLDFEKTLHFWEWNESEQVYCLREENCIWPGSLLDDLRCISEELATRYHWHSADATMFVLCGKAFFESSEGAPQVQALDMSSTTISRTDFKDAFISVKALPWVSLTTVKNLYARTQQKLMRGRGRRQDRPLEVFIFVTRNTGVSPEESAWPELFKKWQSENPGKRYKRSQDFRQDYRRARETLLHHDYAKAWQAASKAEETEGKNEDK